MLNLSELNETQKLAVTFPKTGSLLLIAGPGSGKTYTLTKRIQYMIEELNILPQNILVITFSKAAALSMKQRFQSLTNHESVVYPVSFGTFHSIFYQIIKNSNVKYSHIFFTYHQQKQFMNDILKQHYANRENELEEEGISKSLKNEALLFLDAIAFYKNTNSLKGALRKIPVFFHNDFEKILNLYEKERKINGYADYNDILTDCYQLLNSREDILKMWQSRFPYILIDEFQDINDIQYQIIKLLGKQSNLFAVGDDDQSIYGFRGSSPLFMKCFLQDFCAEQLLLNINYRSNSSVVSKSLKVINENTSRFYKELLANQKCIENQVIIHGFVSLAEESQYICDYLQSVIFEKGSNQTVAVLYRTNNQMQKLVVLLKRLNLKFCLHEKIKPIGSHFVVKDILAYIKLILEIGSVTDFVRVANKPNRKISREDLVMLVGNLEDDSVFNLESRLKHQLQIHSKIGKVAMKNLHLFCNHIERCKRKNSFLIMHMLVKQIGYEKYLNELRVHSKEKQDDNLEILHWILDESKRFQDLYEFYEFLLSASNPICDMDESSRIHIMTIHSSKGLEFDHVIIPDCNEKNSAFENYDDIEEERRILYVGMTRAKKHLELLYQKGTSNNPRQISHLLNPILPQSHQIHNCLKTLQMHQQQHRIPHHLQ